MSRGSLIYGPKLFIPPILVLCFTTTVVGAAPHLIIIKGEALTQQVVLSDWNQNHQFMAAFVDNEIINSEDLVGRPYLELSLFWGPEWHNYVKAGNSIDNLQSERGNQHGRLYLATSTAEPAVSLNGLFARKLDSDGVSILARHGVSVHPATSHFSLPSIRQSLTLSLSLAGIVVVVLFVGRRRLLRRIRPDA